MLFHNYVKYRGQSLGYYFFFDAKQFEAVGVVWTKALCLYLLHLLVPDFWIIYWDTDAVMFDQLFIDLPKDVEPPCIVSATEYAGTHNAGFYYIYPRKLKDMKEEISIVDFESRWSQVLNDEKSVAACRKASDEVTALMRGTSDTYTLQQHQQDMISFVWRGT